MTDLDALWDAELELGKAAQPTTAIAFLDRPEAVRMILAWSLVPLEAVDPEGGPVPLPHPEAPAIDHLRWCWQFVAFDATDWARLADVPRPEVQALGVVMVEHGLVFPDGTVHAIGEKYCNAVAVKMLEKATGVKMKRKKKDGEK